MWRGGGSAEVDDAAHCTSRKPKIVGDRRRRPGAPQIDREAAQELRCNRIRRGWRGVRRGRSDNGRWVDRRECVDGAGREILCALTEHVEALEFEVQRLADEIGRQVIV